MFFRVATCAVLLLSFLLSCTTTQKWNRALKKNEAVIKGVQLQFREGVIEPEMITVAEQLLAEAIPYPVISHTQKSDEQNLLRIFVNRLENNSFDDGSTPGVYSSGYFGAAAVSTAIYPGAAVDFAASYGNYLKGRRHKFFKEKYGYMPLDFNAFATFNNEPVSFYVYKKNERETTIPKYELIKMPAAMQPFGQGDSAEKIIKVSLEAWVQALAEDINKYKR